MSTYRDDLTAARSRLAQLEQERVSLPAEPELAAVQRELKSLRDVNARLRRAALPAAVTARLLVALLLIMLTGFDLVASFGQRSGLPPLSGLAAGWLAAGGALAAVLVIGIGRPHWLIGLGGLALVGGVLCDKPFDAPVIEASEASVRLAFLLPGLLCLGLAVAIFVYRLLRRG